MKVIKINTDTGNNFPKEGRIYVENNFYQRGLRLSMYYEESWSPLKVMAIESWNAIEVGEGASGPSAMNITIQQGQALMDQLWRCGLRPTEGQGSVGQLAAVERHLEDMRTLAFKGEVPKTNRSQSWKS